jgi:hypothetical protein
MGGPSWQEVDVRRLLAPLALVVALTAPALAQDAPREKKKVSIEADGVPLVTILRKLCTEQGINFVADTHVLERASAVTLSLKDVDFEEAIETMGDVCDLEVRLRGKIVTVRAKVHDVPAPKPLPPRTTSPLVLDPVAGPDAPKPAPTPPKAAPDTPKPIDTPKPATDAAKPAPDAPRPPTPPAPDAKPATATAAPAKPDGMGPAPGSAMGTVVDVAKDHLKLKERGGDTRDFYAPEVKNDETLRGERILQALRGLKKGDLVALTFEVDDKGRASITNIIGGPRRAAPAPGSAIEGGAR